MTKTQQRKMQTGQGDDKDNVKKVKDRICPNIFYLEKD